MITIGANGRPVLFQLLSYLKVYNIDALNMKIAETPAFLDESKISETDMNKLIVALVPVPHEVTSNTETTITNTLSATSEANTLSATSTTSTPSATSASSVTDILPDASATSTLPATPRY